MIRHPDLTISVKKSESVIFFIRLDILLLDVSCIPNVSPFPIATMSKIPNKSFFRLLNEL